MQMLCSDVFACSELASGCAETTRSHRATHAPGHHRSMVLPTPEERMLLVESTYDAPFEDWLATRRDEQLNPRPAESPWVFQWAEISQYDHSATIHGRPRDRTRTRTRTFQAGPGR